MSQVHKSTELRSVLSTYQHQGPIMMPEQALRRVGALRLMIVVPQTWDMVIQRVKMRTYIWSLHVTISDITVTLIFLFSLHDVVL